MTTPLDKSEQAKLVANAKTLPKRYFGLHMVEGVAEYSEGEQPYRVLILENALKEMDPTFEGRPVYVRHVADVNLDKLQNEADGYVIKSFFNKLDGKHWCEFLVVSDRGHEAISKGWKLSNAYMPKAFAGGGRWHNVDYAKEITRGEYDHLALVPDPRYEESMILTPEEFKDYNSQKESELRKLANSKETPSMFQFFKKTKVENSAELETTVVTLSNGREVSIKQLINEAEDADKKAADEKAKKENEGDEGGEVPMANEAHHVAVGEKKMTVGELRDAYMASEKKNADEADKAAKAAEKKGEGELVPNAEDEAKKKAEAEAAAKKANDDAAAAKAAEKKANDLKHFNSIYDAPFKADDAKKVLELSSDQVQRGKSRYGSG